MKSVLVNFSFDNTKATFVDGETYGIFDFTDKLMSGEDHVKYSGVSTSQVDTSTKTKVASVTFKAVGEAGDEICFNVTTANINGNNAQVITKCVKIAEPWQRYDQNQNGKIEDNELINAILDWLNNQITDEQLINVILKWLE